MKADKKNTVILYFTRSAQEEARAKKIYRSGSFAQNRAIADKLINHTYRQIKASKLPVKVFDTDNQVGHSFGERLANAFETLYSEGYDNVISVGNDCVALSSDDIKYAANRLNDVSLIAGPALDGGAWLLGINQSAFHKKAFCNLSWETGHFLYDLIDYSQKYAHKPELLKQLADIDYEEELVEFLHENSIAVHYFRLIYYLLSIIKSSTNSYKRPSVFCISCRFRLALSYRGPPA